MERSSLLKPESILIGPHTYYIVYNTKRCNDSENNYGFIKPDTMEIVIDPKNSDDRQRETMLHEILHGLFDLLSYEKLGLIDGDTEEKLIVTLSPAPLSVLQNNDDLVNYLLRIEE